MTFKLQNRSQRDPLIVDETAPQHVLTAVGGNVGFSDTFSEKTVHREKRWEQQKLHGVGYEDDYDYMQHLKVSKEDNKAVLIPVNTSRKSNVLSSIYEEEEEEELVEIMRDEKPVIKLPAVVFPSNFEEDVSLLNHKESLGLRPDWDPDIVAALDDDFDYDNPDNILDDHFMTLANKQIEIDDEDSQHDFDSDDLASDFEFSDEDNKMSKFTGFSMSSSVIRRNDKLQFLDDQFEQTMKRYLHGNGFGDNVEQTADMFEEDDMRGIAQETATEILLPKTSRSIQSATTEEDDILIKQRVLDKFEYERGIDEDVVTIYKSVPAVVHDCESILSTYSNIYNHPKIIDVTKKPQRKEKTIIEAIVEEPSEVQACKKIPAAAINQRKKGETAEEKRIRKQAVKEANKARTESKKVFKKAFKVEINRRKKEVLNITRNLQGVKL